MIHRLSVTLIAIGLMAVPAVPFSTTPAQAGSVTPAIDPSWVRWDAGTKTAYLTIIAGYRSLAGGFTFNGYGQGRLTITVPVGAKVVIAFTNQSSSPHSAVITPFAKRTLAANFPPAFPGAASPNAGNGVAHLTRPQTFSFHAGTAGTYALVCGVPGHALAGMWDVFRVATVDRPAMRTTRAAAATEHSVGQHKSRRAMTGSVEGVVRDATSGRPIAHAYAILGWTTFKRVGETDAYGHYRIDHVPTTRAVPIFGFAQGYIYNHNRPIPIKAGETTAFSFKLPRQRISIDQLPHLRGATISPRPLKAGQTATFSVHARPGKGGPLSKEVFAVNALFGYSVLLQHAGPDLYRGSWTIPADVAPGDYSFAFFAAMENCLVNAAFQHATLTITE